MRIDSDRFSDFDLKKALAGSPICNKMGMPIHDFESFCVTAAYGYSGIDLNGDLQTWTKGGIYQLSSIDDLHDLVMYDVEPTTAEGYVISSLRIGKDLYISEDPDDLDKIMISRGEYAVMFNRDELPTVMDALETLHSR